MVADVRHHDQVFADGEEGVDARLAVGVVPVEQIHRRDNEEVVRNLKPILQNFFAVTFDWCDQIGPPCVFVPSLIFIRIIHQRLLA